MLYELRSEWLNNSHQVNKTVYQGFGGMSEVNKELRVLQSQRGKLTSALENINLATFSEELCKFSIIENQSLSDFISLDERVESTTKVRYLLQLVCDKVRHSKWLFDNVLIILKGFRELIPVGEHMDKVYKAKEPIQVQLSDRILTKQDIPVLMNELASVAYKWEDIGIALYVPMVKLNDISDKKSSTTKLHGVLNVWIVEGTILKPVTLTKFKEILKGPTVELPAIADTFCFIKPLPSSNRLCLDITPNFHERVLSQSLDTVVSYGKSTLLEVQVHSNEPVTYQWTKDGQPLSEGTSYQGTSSSILLVNHRNMASQHIEGSYVCKVEGIRRSREISVSIEYPGRIQSLLDNYFFLWEVPKDTWSPVETKSFVELALIKRESDILKEYDYSVRGDMDDILRKKEKISYEDCFGKYRSRALLVVEGRPGVGKTTLAQKVTRDWSTGGNVLVGADLVFLVSLRILNADSNLSELLEDFCDTVDEDLMKCLESQRGNKSCFLLDGLDEYQYSNSKKNIFNLLNKKLSQAMVIVFSRPIGCKKLKNSGDKRIEILGFNCNQIYHYIETYFLKQPEMADHLKKYLDLHINVLHMCYLPVHAAMICYIYTQCKDNNIPNTETEIYERFTLLMIIRDMMRDKNSDTPISLQHDIRDMMRDENSDIPTSLQNLNKKYQDYFEKICELAFNKTVNSEQIFKFDGPSLGLVTVDSAAKHYKMQDFYTFLHLTFQEYLAAYHLFSQPEDQQLNIIDQHKDNAAMLVVWKFYCGLMGQQTQILHKQICKIFSSKHADTLYRVHCAFESQQSVVCDAVTDCREQQSSLSFKKKFFTRSDCNAISYVISEATHPTLALEFYSCRLQKDGIEHLVKTSNHRLQEVTTLLYHSATLTIDQFPILNYLLKRMQLLEVLDLSKTTLSPNAVNKLTVNVILPKLKCLRIQLPFLPNKNFGKTLDVLSSRIKPESIQFYMKNERSKEGYFRNVLKHYFNSSDIVCLNSDKTELVDWSNLEIEKTLIFSFFSNCTAFNFVNCSIEDDMITTLTEGLKECNSVEKLVLDFNRISGEGATALVPIISNLKHLSMKCNFIDDRGAKSLASGLQGNTDLVHLDLECNSFGDEGAIAIASAVRHLDISLYLWNASITEEGATSVLGYVSSTNVYSPQMCDFKGANTKDPECLSKALQCCTSHTCIKLFFGYLRPDCAKHLRNLKNLKEIDIRSKNIPIEIFDVFKSFTFLQSLGISKNNIRSEGALALADCLKSCIKLQTLEISKTNIGSEGALALADSLKSCTNLQTLDISENSIGPEGAAALADGLKSCTNLQTLDISENSIGREGAAALADGLQFCTNLEVLDISENDIGSEGAVALADGLRFCINLKSLEFMKNSIDSKGAIGLGDHLKFWANLQTLDISWNSVCSKGAEPLFNGLKSCTNLKTLDISFNKIYSKGAVVLALGLKSCTNLQTLDISRNSIGSEGAVALADGLKSCTNLQILNICWNSIGSEGAVVLADGLKSCTNLQTLDISRNSIGSEGAVALADGLKSCTNLQTLDLSFNSIGSGGTVALADGLKSWTNLQRLNISGNGIGLEGTVALADGVKSCTNFQVLDIRGNSIGSEGQY